VPTRMIKVSIASRTEILNSLYAVRLARFV
jgi:hypothetical protein